MNDPWLSGDWPQSVWREHHREIMGLLEAERASHAITRSALTTHLRGTRVSENAAPQPIMGEPGRRGRPGAYLYNDEVYLGVSQAADYLGINRKTLKAMQRQHPTELPVYAIINSPHCYRQKDLDAARAKYLVGPVPVTVDVDLPEVPDKT